MAEFYQIYQDALLYIFQLWLMLFYPVISPHLLYVVSNLNSKISSSDNATITAASGVTLKAYAVHKFGRVLVFHLQFNITSAKSNGDVIFSGIPDEYKSVHYAYNTISGLGGGAYIIGINPSGNIFVGATGLPVKEWYSGILVALSAN